MAGYFARKFLSSLHHSPLKLIFLSQFIQELINGTLFPASFLSRLSICLKSIGYGPQTRGSIRITKHGNRAWSSVAAVYLYTGTIEYFI